MPSERNVSLKDLAAAAGVSTMTVSRVLSGRGLVSAERRAAVEAAAQRLGYRVNPLVRRMMSELRRGSGGSLRGTVAFLNASEREADWHTMPYLRPSWEGAKQRAAATGFAFDEIWLNAPGWTAARTHAVLRTRGIDALLVVPGSRPEQVAFPLDDFALASFGGLAFELPVHQVLPDYFFNVGLCYRRLWELGYRRIGLFVPDYERRMTDGASIGGYLSAQWESQARARLPIGTHPNNWQASETAFKRWVKQARPDAVIATYNEVGRWLQELGLEVPHDLGLVHPGLADDVAGWSGVDPDHYAQGAQAVDLLTAQVFRNERGLPLQPKRTTIKGRWVDGTTTREQPSRRG
jgi:DNA-binding LacI/PurR family transcriptional regulator